MTTSQTPEQLASLLRLPLELREQIYTHLLTPTTPSQCSHPIPSVGLTSVSHAPPPLPYLLTHPTITSELLSHFYSLASWKLVFSHAFNFFRTDPELLSLEASHVLKRIRKVELVFFQDILLLKEYPSFGLEAFCAEIRRRADRACDVLLQAPELRSVTISWIDTTRTGGWEAKAGILEPLGKLKGRFGVRVGEVRFCGRKEAEGEEREGFLWALGRVLGEGAAKGAAKGGKERVGEGKEEEELGEPCELRMLAFDVRQQRVGGKRVGAWMDAVRLPPG